MAEVGHTWCRLKPPGLTCSAGRGIHRPEHAKPNWTRTARAFCDMFARLQAEHQFRAQHDPQLGQRRSDPRGGRPGRVDGFQYVLVPAVRYRTLETDAVWHEPKPAPVPAPRCWPVSDERCNRTAWGFYGGALWHRFLGDTDPTDLAARGGFFVELGGVHFNTPPRLLAATPRPDRHRLPNAAALRSSCALPSRRAISPGPPVGQRPWSLAGSDSRCGRALRCRATRMAR